MSWLVVLNAIGAVQGLFLAAVLAGWRTNAAANRWLALFLTAYSLILLQDVLEQSRLLRALPHLANVTAPLLFLLGPLLWRYVLALTEAGARLRSFVWHAIPAGLLVLLLAPFYLSSAAQKLRALEAEWASSSLELSLPLLALMVQIAAYLTLCARQVGKYHRRLGDFYSNVERRRIDWLRQTVIAGLVLFAVWLLATWTQQAWAKVLDALGFPIVVYALGYLALRQGQAFAPGDAPTQTAQSAPVPVIETPSTTNPVPVVSAERSALPAHEGSALTQSLAQAANAKYEKSALSADAVARYRQHIENYVSLEKPYLENDLTLAQFAQRLAMSEHHLSQMLNVHFGKTFFDYVNQQRVDEVKRCLRDASYQHQTILEIALASGFSSKATFNASFKKFTGLTPSRFREADRLSESSSGQSG